MERSLRPGLKRKKETETDRQTDRQTDRVTMHWDFMTAEPLVIHHRPPTLGDSYPQASVKGGSIQQNKQNRIEWWCHCRKMQATTTQD